MVTKAKTKTKTKTKAKKRNPQDATMRNVRAASDRMAEMEKELLQMRARQRRIALTLDRIHSVLGDFVFTWEEYNK